jgi:hypothetical protein
LVGLGCVSCSQSTHLITDCKSVHFNPNRLLLLYRYSKGSQQEWLKQAWQNNLKPTKEKDHFRKIQLDLQLMVSNNAYEIMTYCYKYKL